MKSLCLSKIIFCEHLYSVCKEYKSKVTKVSIFSSLLLSSAPLHEVSAETCVQSTGLIVGGMKTQIGEFPHMSALGIRKFSSAGSRRFNVIISMLLLLIRDEL